MKAAVVGGAGFIGSNLVDALVERGDDVVIVDNLVDRLPPQPEPRRDAARGRHRRRLRALTTALHGRDVVFLTAALPRVPRSIEDPVGTHAVNVTGALRVLKAAVDAGVRRVIYSSSSSVYGDQPTLPLTEDMPPNPLNPYACQKLMGEIYARNFARIYGLETVCLRYFNVYGPRQVTEGAYRLVISIFMDQRTPGEPMTIHGDGLQTRDFTWVGDVVRANILAAESDRVGQRRADQRRRRAGGQRRAHRRADRRTGRARRRRAASTSASNAPASSAPASCSAGSRTSRSTRACAASWSCNGSVAG